MKALNLDKVKFTKNGCPVEIWKRDRVTEGRILGRYKDSNDNWRLYDWDADGYGQEGLELVEGEDPVCLNLYPCKKGLLIMKYINRQEADKNADKGRVACIPLTKELLEKYKV